MGEARRAEVVRKTTETDIRLELNLDGRGVYEVETGVPFFNHMLELFSKHSAFDLKILAKGDIEIDYHHTVEDVGICLGQAIGQALGDGKGIRRYGECLLPMQEALCSAALDLCGRSFLVYRFPGLENKVGDFDVELGKDFFQALSANAKMTLHLNLQYGDNRHHVLEAAFKAVARALRMAVERTGDPKDIPSTKGVL